MPIWKDQNTAAPAKPQTPGGPDTPPRAEPVASASAPSSYDLPSRPAARDVKESIIAADLTIEGKIEGAGHVRIAGRFKGDVHIQGNLTIEAGAKITGGVRAAAVFIAGELEGNVDSAQRVELLETGVLSGDLKAGSLTVAAGSRMRGQVEFGWSERGPAA